MCYAAHIGTNIKLPTNTFEPGKSALYITDPSQDKVLDSLKSKFTKKHIYHIGSYEGCSCVLSCDPTDDDEADENDDKEQVLMATKSVTAFLSLINNLTKQEDLELYCCWEGDWDSPIEYRQQIDIRQIELGKNYFDLTEKELIVFTKQQ